MNNKPKEYPNLTKEKIEQYLNDIFYSNNPKGLKTLFPEELPKDFNLDDQIKDGYLYQVTTEGHQFSIQLMTGSGGIRDMIKASRKAGIPDFYIVDDIKVLDNGILYPIRDIKWTPIIKEDGK